MSAQPQKCFNGKMALDTKATLRSTTGLVRQRCEGLLPMTSLVVLQASFPAVGRLSGTANTPN